MSVNKYKPHVHLISEDDANRQLAVGFLGHYAVDDGQVSPRDPAGGWGKVLDVFEMEYLQKMRENNLAHVVMMIDFDEHVQERRAIFDQRIPQDVKERVFVIGSLSNPETLRAALGISWERIGDMLAQDCLKGDLGAWRHPLLVHNSDELERLVKRVKPILFHAS